MTVLLQAEQGFGDTLQFVRYARLVRERAGKVILASQPELARLIARGPDIDRVIVPGESVPEFTATAPLMSLPLLLGTSLETIPASIPYLIADPNLIERWRSPLASLDGLRVGLCWRGSPTHPGDRWRSIPLAAFAPLAGVAGVRLVSLQVGHGSEQLPGASFRIMEPGAIKTFDDTAAILMNLDLIVCCDTSIAHLAGALGRPVWLALPFAPDWRWMLDRSDSPWYPTMRLFRQKSPEDWDGVVRLMAAELERGGVSRGTVTP